VCAIYLVEILKTSFFDSWVYDAVSEIAAASKNLPASALVDVNDTTFIITMQDMVGGGLKAAKSDYCPTGTDADDAFNLFQAVVFKHDVSTGSVDPDYDKYNPPQLQHSNTGGKHLVSLKFIPWSIELMRFIIDSYRKENIVANRREYIAMNLTKLRKDETILLQFKQIVTSLNISIDDKLLSSIHLRIAEYAFRAYTKQRNNDEFNKVKALASESQILLFVPLFKRVNTRIQKTKPRPSHSLTPKYEQRYWCERSETNQETTISR